MKSTKGENTKAAKSGKDVVPSVLPSRVPSSDPSLLILVLSYSLY